MNQWTETAIVCACAAVMVAALMIAWAQWVAVGTRHDWTAAVNRLGQRVTNIDRAVGDHETRLLDLETKEMER